MSKECLCDQKILKKTTCYRLYFYGLFLNSLSYVGSAQFVLGDR